MAKSRNGREHRHPSLTCYKVHRCRCDDCNELNNEYNRVRRETKRNREIPNVLPPEEVARLRKMVGLE